MNDHPADEHPGAPPEVIRRDIGGWVSGPSVTTEPVPAGQIGAGDVLLHDGTAVTVTATRASRYWFGPELCDGLAIDWESGSRLGRMFRRATDMLDRVVPR